MCARGGWRRGPIRRIVAFVDALPELPTLFARAEDDLLFWVFGGCGWLHCGGAKGVLMVVVRGRIAQAPSHRAMWTFGVASRDSWNAAEEPLAGMTSVLDSGFSTEQTPVTVTLESTVLGTYSNCPTPGTKYLEMSRYSTFIQESFAVHI